MTTTRRLATLAVPFLILLASPNMMLKAQRVAPERPQSGRPDARPPRVVPWRGHSDLKRQITVNDLQFAFKNRIDIKFREGSGVRSRKGRLTVEKSAARDGAPVEELEQVNRILSTFATRHVAVRMHYLPEAELDAFRRDGEKRSGEQVPDLNLAFHLYVEVASNEALAKIINALNRLDIVEIAYASRFPPFPGLDRDAAEKHQRFLIEHERLPFPSAEEVERIEKGWLPPGANRDAMPSQHGIPLRAPQAMTAPTSPDGSNGALNRPADSTAATGARYLRASYRPLPGAGRWLSTRPMPLPGSFVTMQDYGEAAPTGVDVDYLRAQYWAAWGNLSGYTDVEYNWNFFHSDLTDLTGPVLVNGQPAQTANAYVNHGTAVAGELTSNANNYGTTGLVPDSSLALSTEWPTSGPNRPAAIAAAAFQFWPGAVILLEMQTGAGFDCNGDGIVAALNLPSADLVPCEWEPLVKDAIKAATANGRIVVEAAGNGNCNLDLAGFNSKFQPYNPDDPNAPANANDSGAIIVGAGDKTTRARSSFSTYGNRVDLQAEGDSQIVTTGYGDAASGVLYSAEGVNLWYTSQFGGTSGASPIVTGSAVSLGGILYGYYGSYFAPKELRRVLRQGATAQTGVAPLKVVGPRPNLKTAVEFTTNRHLQMQLADFDGDGKSDYAVWTPATGMWKIRLSTNGSIITVQWGQKGDIPCPANVLGDIRAELIVFRPSTGTWRIYNLATATSTTVQWGQMGDIPVPLKYDNDGYADYAVYRSVDSGMSSAQWLVKTSVTNQNFSIPFNKLYYAPMARDFDGDGKDDLTAFNAGAWTIRPSSTLVSVTRTLGAYGDIPLTYKSGGKWNLAVWRPSNGTFYTKPYTDPNAPVASYQYGVAGDIPRFGDTDGNGQDEYIVYRNPGKWFNAVYGQLNLGVDGDYAIAK